MQPHQTLTLIIPVYNGQQYIQKTCDELHTFCIQNHFIKKIVFVDDGSTDQTREYMQKYGCGRSFDVEILGYKKNEGKGHAIKLGFERRGQTDCIAFTDVELPYGLEVFKNGLDLLVNSKADIVVGNRHIVKSIHFQYNRYRGFFTKIFHMLLPKGVRMYEDTQCGLKMFTQDAAHVLFSKIKTYRWIFDVELFIIAIRKKMVISEVPVVLKQSCRTRGGVSVLRHGWYIIKDMMIIYRNDKQGLYERD